MALLWTDGMDRYGAAADFASNGGYYATAPTSFQATGGKTGGGCARCTDNTSIRKTFAVAGVLASGAGVHFCGWFKASALSTDAIMLIGTDVNVVTATAFAPKIATNVNGSLSVTKHNQANVTLATSAAGVISAGTYFHIEYAAKYDTAGFIKVWVNGNIVINFSGDTTIGTPTAYTAVALGKVGSAFDGANYDWDDIICWDESGTDFALTQLTTAYLPVIETLTVDGNDAVQFTPSTGSNFQNVDDPAFQNGDGDYNASGTVGQADQFTLADQAAAPQYTFGMALKTVAKIDAAGTVNLRTRLVSGGTTTDSADKLLTTAYVLYADYFGKDPATAAVWATTKVNSLKCGYKYQS